MGRYSRHTPFQFFVEDESIHDGYIYLLGRAFHKAKVQRISPGETITACTSQKIYRGRVREVSGQEIRAQVFDEKPLLPEPFAVHLFAGILKGDKFDLVVEKATELGVWSVTPIVTLRSIPRLDQEKALARKERWEKIALEASEQSHRTTIPLISKPLSFMEALGASPKGPRFFFHEGLEEGVTKNLLELLSLELPNNGSHSLLARRAERSDISLFVGPEGGFDEQEVLAAKEKGFQMASLGPRILRAETASLAAIAIVSQFCQGILENPRS